MSPTLAPEDLKVRSFETLSDEKREEISAGDDFCTDNWDQTEEASCCGTETLQ